MSWRRRAALAVALSVALGNVSAGQARVVVPDAGPGQAGRILRDALRRPHRLAGPDSTPLVITSDVQVRGSLIVLGRSARIEGTVNGDVIVVNGDLYVRTGARIDGSAIAIGGGTYPTALASIGGDQQSFRFDTFRITPTADGYRLDYEPRVVDGPPPLLFPGVYGLRLPQYDRVNGLSLPFGPTIASRHRRFESRWVATLRTDLGVVDPSLEVEGQLTRRSRITLGAERGSISNEAWIWPDIVNSLSVLALGEDTRNWFRADAGEFRLHHLWETGRGFVEPFVGARVERDWSVGPGIAPTSGPWSVLGRTDSSAMWRPNPLVAPGTISAAVVGAIGRWESNGVTLGFTTRIEASLQAPSDARFQQVTSDVALGFPTSGEQEYAIDVHWVTTLGDTPPPQRFVYLGGAGTLPFNEMLSFGGDELLLIDQRYTIPLRSVTLGMFGNPALQLRHRIGAAGLGKLRSFKQVVGVGLSLTVIRGEVQFDPVEGKVRGAVGFTFSR